MEAETRAHVQKPQLGLNTATTATSHVPLGGSDRGRFCTPGCRAGLGSRFHQEFQSHGGGEEKEAAAAGEEAGRGGAPQRAGRAGQGARGPGGERSRRRGRRWRPRPPTEGPPSWWDGGGKPWQREARARSQGRGANAAGGDREGAARGEGRGLGAAQGRWEPSPRDLILRFWAGGWRCRERQPVVTGRAPPPVA